MTIIVIIDAYKRHTARDGRICMCLVLEISKKAQCCTWRGHCQMFLPGMRFGKHSLATSSWKLDLTVAWQDE